MLIDCKITYNSRKIRTFACKISPIAPQMEINSRYNYNDLTMKLLLLNLVLQALIVGDHVIEFTHLLFIRLGGVDNAENQLIEGTIGVSRFICWTLPAVYFALSGWLFFKGFDEAGSWLAKIKRRGRSLLVPYLIWNLLASPWLTAVLIPLVAIVAPSLGTPRPMTAMECFWGTEPMYFPANAPLWFVRDLMILVLFAPLIWQAVRSRYAPLWLAATALWWSYEFSCGIGFWECMSQGLFGFSLGAWWRARGQNAVDFGPKALAGAVATLCCAVACCSVWSDNTALYSLWQGPKAVAMCVMLAAFAVVLAKKAPWLAFWGEGAIFLYMSHMIGLNQVAEAVMVATGWPMLAVCAASYVAVLTLWLGIWAALRRFAPRMLNVLTGGRVRSRCVPQVRRAD